jgi:hypothetical protein
LSVGPPERARYFAIDPGWEPEAVIALIREMDERVSGHLRDPRLVLGVPQDGTHSRTPVDRPHRATGLEDGKA